MNERPNFIFKYASADTEEQRSHLIDLIKNKALYMPTKYQLNDPMEGCAVKLRTLQAGSWISEKLDTEDVGTMEIRRHYKLIAFSPTAFSTIMWAYYTNNYRGVCLCFRTDNTLKDIQKVEYIPSEHISEEITFYGTSEDEDNDPRVYESFFKKQCGWRHENEWRIVKKTDDEFLPFENDLVGIIIGANLKFVENDDDKKGDFEKLLVETAAKTFPNIKLFRMYIGHNSMRINLCHYDDPAYGDGFDKEFISRDEEIVGELMNEEKDRVSK